MNRFALCTGLALFAAAGPAFAADAGKFPQRPIRFIVPYSPGGTSDFTARLVGDALTKELGQQLVVDNRAGAGSALGTKIVAEANPDGYTIIMNNVGLASNETLRPDRDYVALRDLTPISLIGFTPSVLVVNTKSPYKSVKQWVDDAKAHPGKISFGSAGAGSSTHLSMEYLERVLGLKLLHVPYKGGGPATAAMMAGEVDCVLAPVPTIYPHLHGGRLRALAVSSAKRSGALPNLPTMKESGVPFVYSTWYGLLAPAGTPKAIIAKLNHAVVHALNEPKLHDKLVTTGLDPQPDTPEDFRQIIQSDIEKWRKVIDEAGITKRG